MATVIDLIVDDIARPSMSRTGRALLVVAAWALAMLMAFALRRDFIGVFTWDYLTPSALMALSSGVLLWTALTPRSLSGRRRRLLMLASAGVLLASLLHFGTPPGPAYATTNEFWGETLACLSKGLAMGGLAAMLLSIVMFRYLPLPTRREQLLAGICASALAILMLNMHCMSPDYGHIVLGHWAAAVPLVLLILMAQRWYVGHRARLALAAHGRRLHGWRRMT